MLRLNINLFFVKFIFILNAFITSAQNACTLDKVAIPVNPTRVILQYQCYSGTSYNPIIPIDFGSEQREYNELDLSPNLYNIIDYGQLCPFTNIYLLDLSFNSISNLTNAFKALACLRSLTRLDLSSNLISTALKSSDFNDTFASRLKSINLNNNKIPSIESQVFFKQDGTSRFINLEYLGLVNNQLKSLDLLWPMSLPSSILKIDLSYNQIDKLTNELKKSFSESVFIPMTGNRHVYLINNSLVSLDDSNLLQYQINSANGFSQFLNKLSNYDFRKNNSDYSCLCPAATGLYTVLWYKNISSSISDKTAPIFKLNCSNVANTYIFDFPCTFIGTTSTTSTTTTSTSTTTSSTTTTTTSTTSSTTSTTTTSTATTAIIITTTSTITTTNTSTLTYVTTTLFETTIVVNTIGQLINEQSLRKNSTNEKQWDLLFLILLIIPLMFIFVMLFICCFGRCCSTFFFDCCSIRLCGCIKPKAESKKYDLTIFCNHYDELWVDKNFMPKIFEFKKGFKIYNLSDLSQSDLTLDKEKIEVVKASKRLVLIVTKKFIQNEWSNNNIRDLIKDISVKDQDCSILAICVGDVTVKQIKQHMNEIEPDENKKNILTKLRAKLASRINYNLHLRNIEIFDFHKDNFWNRFHYALPSKKLKKSNEIIDSTENIKSTQKLPPLENPEKNRSDRKSSIIVENDIQLVSRAKNSVNDSKVKAIKLIDSKKVYPKKNENREEIKSKLLLKDDEFWEASETKYEPVGSAGSSSKGNKQSYLNRFGLPPLNGPVIENPEPKKIKNVEENNSSNIIRIPEEMLLKLTKNLSSSSNNETMPQSPINGLDQQNQNDSDEVLIKKKSKKRVTIREKLEENEQQMINENAGIKIKKRKQRSKQSEHFNHEDISDD